MKTLFKLFFVMFLASSAFGQGATCQSGYVCNGAETTNGDAVILYPPQDAATVVVNISGTWSGTISFKGSNGGVYVANTCTSQSAATTATTTTANDQWRCPVAGLTSFEAVSTASMTGSATVTVTASKGSPSLGGGGGSGTGFPVTTTVQVTSPGEINFATGSTLNLASGSTFSCAGTGCPAKTDLSNLANPTAMQAGQQFNSFQMASGATLTIPSGATLTCAAGSTCPAGVSSVVIAGTANQIGAGGTCTITSTGTCTLSLLAAEILGTDNSTAGTVQLANGSASAHTIFGSAATTSNSILGPAVVVANNHALGCSTSGTVALSSTWARFQPLFLQMAPLVETCREAIQIQVLHRSTGQPFLPQRWCWEATQVSSSPQHSLVQTNGVETIPAPQRRQIAGFLIGAANVTPSGYAAGGGTANAQTVTLSPAVPALATGLEVRWLPTAANTTTTPTLAVSGLTAKTLTKCGQTALVASDLLTTAIADAVYDGTDFELQNPQTGICGVSAQPSRWQEALSLHLQLLIL